MSDRTVRAAIASGADTVDEVAARCGAGEQCGSCWPSLARLLGDQGGARLDDQRTSAA